MKRKQLSRMDKDFLALILRSPDEGEGWRLVSKTMVPWVKKIIAQELIEFEETPEGGRIRFSTLGLNVLPYIL